MFGLPVELTVLFIFCIVLACAFEFINGFHDTANAVATVIYTHSLKPVQAVIWSGFWNALGVFAGGVVVAMSIVNLLPIELLIDSHITLNISMVLSLLLAAILWNLGTWYFGIPCSSSHTLIGAILGVGIAYSMMPGHVFGTGVNWGKAKEIGFALFFSPFVGFTLTVMMMFFLRTIIKDRSFFKEADVTRKPPTWIRGILITTCTFVSFSHGNNDGQKGVGLLLLILIGFAPSYFAIDHTVDIKQLETNVAHVNQILDKVDTFQIDPSTKFLMEKTKNEMCNLQEVLSSTAPNVVSIKDQDRFEARKHILFATKSLGELVESQTVNLSLKDKAVLKAEIKGMKKFIEYAPKWVILLISLSLGLGTMIGWKRIVVTIGEKIGKHHLSYAQGASAELVAALTIGLASSFKLPVSTTHVLSSGIAGSMVASKGVKNLRKSTVTNMLLAWILTLPVTILLSGGLFFFFNWLFSKFL